jgi:hypothetical protein
MKLLSVKLAFNNGVHSALFYFKDLDNVNSDGVHYTAGNLSPLQFMEIRRWCAKNMNRRPYKVTDEYIYATYTAKEL